MSDATLLEIPARDLGGLAAAPDRRRRVAIVIPVLDDWPSFLTLLDDIDAVPVAPDLRFDIHAVDDGSSRALDADLSIKRYVQIDRIETIELACNIGHQRAIAVGLATIVDAESIEGVVVMDADGEDRPDDIPKLMAAAEAEGAIACARRVQRWESWLFLAFYALYKRIFRWLSGARLDFGNFCYIPNGKPLRSLVRNPHVWNHLAAAIVRSRMPLCRIDCARGRRYGGRSLMGFQGLIVHGLSAISVYGDLALVRIILATAAVGLVTLGGILAVATIRLVTDLAIPGWTTTTAGLLLVLLAQCFMLATIAAFMLLGARSAPLVVPARDALQYVVARRCRWEAKAPAATGP
jgi:hypothetical protein